MDEKTLKQIVFNVMIQLAPCGEKAGRYLYIDSWRNELIDLVAKEMGLNVNESDRLNLEKELKNSWQRLLDSRF